MFSQLTVTHRTQTGIMSSEAHKLSRLHGNEPALFAASRLLFTISRSPVGHDAVRVARIAELLEAIAQGHITNMTGGEFFEDIENRLSQIDKLSLEQEL